METFISRSPLVRLIRGFTSPFRNAVATAKTCYSSQGIVDDDQVGSEFERIGRSIYSAGHHTTFQHAHFQFALSNVSRQFIWSFLHSHPFYNSEQVSQRYVAVQADSFAIPPLHGPALDLYRKTAQSQLDHYEDLVRILTVPMAEEVGKLFRRTPRIAQRFDRAVLKKAREVARYVLPVATFACLYHTISGVTLLRYHRICLHGEAPLEQQIVVGKMVAALLQFDPLYQSILEEPLDPETLHTLGQDIGITGNRGFASDFLREFDKRLDGRVSKLVSYKTNNEELLATAVREVMGLPTAALGDEDAIRLALDPSRNRLLGETLNLTTHGKLTRALFHPGYTFCKKLSHTADSQNQRHRMTPASRPDLAAHLSPDPDYIRPALLDRSPQAERVFKTSMEQAWDAIHRLIRLGIPREFALYLLPNAAAVRFTESSDLLNLRHKHAMRLCYNSQEEIWRASVDEVLQIREVNPVIGRYLLPPCTLRKMAEVKPKCPEGDRFCGVPVWQLDIDQYNRII